MVYILVDEPGYYEPTFMGGRNIEIPNLDRMAAEGIAEAAGIAPPTDTGGISILPELIGAEAAGHPQQQHDFLYWEYAGGQAVRKGNWRGESQIRKTRRVELVTEEE